MRKFLFVILALFLPLFVSAQEFFALQNPLGSKDFEGLIEAVINWLLMVTLPILVILMLYAGFQFIVSGISPEGKKNAANIIKYALIGYSIMLLAKVLVGVVGGLFT